MTGWIIYDKKQFNKNEWFAEKLLAYSSENAEMRLIIVESLTCGIIDNSHFFCYKGQRLKTPDFVIMRCIYPKLSEFLENAGSVVFNSGEISRICNDKRLTYSCVSKADVPMLNTSFFDRRFLGDDILPDKEYPLILKSAAGHGGAEVFWINNRTELLQHVRSLPQDEFLAQDVCKSIGLDIRVYIIGGKILSSVLRTSDSFKSNYSLGSSASIYKLAKDEENTVQKIIGALPSVPDFVGIDFLPCNGKLYFNEIEDVVGTRMLYGTAHIDAARVYVDYILKKIKI